MSQAGERARYRDSGLESPGGRRSLAIESRGEREGSEGFALGLWALQWPRAPWRPLQWQERGD